LAILKHMSPELDKYLCEKYPKIFANRNKSAEESCMNWGLECGDGWFFIIDSLCYRIQRHIDHPPYLGVRDWKKFVCSLQQVWNLIIWNKIVYPLVKNMPRHKYIKYSNRWQYQIFTHEPAPAGYIQQVVFEQVKEKFSGLRIYYSGGDQYISALVSLAEDISMHTCEVCGRMDATVGRNRTGWKRTTCAEHARDLNNFRYNNEDARNIFESIKNKK